MKLPSKVAAATSAPNIVFGRRETVVPSSNTALRVNSERDGESATQSFGRLG